MKLTAPIFRLKRNARQLSRNKRIPLHEALKSIALQEGYASWSLLASQAANRTHAQRVHERLSSGDMLLVGARPGEGKTLLSLEIVLEGLKSGHRGAFFTLDYTERDIAGVLDGVAADLAQHQDRFAFDDSDEISAGYITESLGAAAEGTIVVIDYLQLLDQKRSNPELMQQVEALRDFAVDRRLILVFVSQIDRAYDPSVKPCPDFDDVRLPNPVDLNLFNKACFMNDGVIEFQSRH